VVRAARKEVQRLERALAKVEAREVGLHEQMAASATDHARLRELDAELAALVAEREALETAWLEASATLET
jgi:ATP-binding cassette subfamily F protein uup